MANMNKEQGQKGKRPGTVVLVPLEVSVTERQEIQQGGAHFPRLNRWLIQQGIKPGAQWVGQLLNEHEGF